MEQVTRLSERAKQGGLHALSQSRNTLADDHQSKPWQRKILVVDDNPDTSGSFNFLLRLNGAWVESAGSGDRAIDLARTFHPDIVIMDIGMPGLDGYESCRQMRRQPGGKSQAMLAVTGRGSEADKQACREAGFDYHLLKPVEIALLQSVIDEAMSFYGVGIR